LRPTRHAETAVMKKYWPQCTRLFTRLQSKDEFRPFRASLTLTLSRGERGSFRAPIDSHTTNKPLRKACIRVNSYQYFSPETLFFLVFWLFLMTYGRSELFKDPDTFLHTAVGERMLESGRLIYTDPFSFTHHGRPWIAQQWLAECAMAVIHKLDGLDGLLLVTATLLAGFYAWILHRLARSGLQFMMAFLILALAFACSSLHFHVRPLIASILLLGIVFAWLGDYESGRKSVYRLAWLVPLFILWTNLHGGVLGGLGTLAVAAGGWTAWKILGWESPIQGVRDGAVLYLVVLLCFLSIYINPYGAELPKAWFSIYGSSVVPQVIDEHVSAWRQGAFFLLFFGAAYGLVLAGIYPRRPRITWLIPLVWLYLACTRIRNAPLFALVATIALGDFFFQSRVTEWMVRKGSVTFRRIPYAAGTGRDTLRRWAVPGGLVALALVLHGLSVSVPVLGTPWAKLNPRHWPVALLPELQAYAAAHPEGTPVFNDFLYGGFLIYHTPRLRVYIDGRCELYGDEGLLGYGNLDGAAVTVLAERYGFDIALLENDSHVNQAMRTLAGWEVWRQGGGAVLYRRINPGAGR